MEAARLEKFVRSETRVVSFDPAERVTLLRESQLFACLSNAECTEIAGRARSRTFGRSDFFFQQGQPFRQLILVESGCVKLTRLSPNGSEVILGLRGTREALDLPAGAAFSNHTCSAQALVRCKTLIWDWSTMERMMSTTPQFSRNICRILTQQLHQLEERYQELSGDNVARRLACTLIRLTAQFGTQTDRGHEIAISRQELAQMTGTTLFTVSRLISKWGELGLIVPRREAVLMLNPERLELVSSMQQLEAEKHVSPPAKPKRVAVASLTVALTAAVLDRPMLPMQ